MPVKAAVSRCCTWPGTSASGRSMLARVTMYLHSWEHFNRVRHVQRINQTDCSHNGVVLTAHAGLTRASRFMCRSQPPLLPTVSWLILVVLGGFVVRATSEVQGMKLETVGLSDEG